MKKILLMGLLLAPFSAQAQCNSWTAGGGCTCCGGYTIVGGVNNGDSFVTKHEWKVKSPGVLELTATSFTIKGEFTDRLHFSIYFRNKQLIVDKLSSLDEFERYGVNQAKDMEAAGMDIK